MGALPGCAHGHTEPSNSTSDRNSWEKQRREGLQGMGREMGCRTAKWDTGGLCLMQATKSRKTKGWNKS